MAEAIDSDRLGSLLVGRACNPGVPKFVLEYSAGARETAANIDCAVALDFMSVIAWPIRAIR